MKKTEDIGILLKQINDALGKDANNKLKKDNLTISQIRFLSYMMESGKERVSLKELEKVFQVSQPTVAGIIKRMKEKGLVKTVQNQEDTRAKDVILSSAGRKMMEEGKRGRDRMEEVLLSGLKPAEQKELRRMLEIVRDSLKQTG